MIVIFDWKRTLYDPDTQTLLPGVQHLLSMLHAQQIKTILVGKGSDEMYAEVDRLGVKNYFSAVIFQPEKKNLNIIKKYFPEEELVVIGDRVRSEIALGNEMGAKTIWIKAGKFAYEDPIDSSQEPTYTATNIFEVEELLSNHFL